MERLTYKTGWGKAYLENGADAVWKRQVAYDVLDKAVQKLAEYENLEEQGLLLKLPCKVGSIVYEINKDLNSMKRETIEHNGHYYHRNINVYFITQVTFEIEDINSLGKTVFLTKAEAEKALEEMKGE